MSGSATRANALDHVVVVLFENRSLDNVLGHLYGPGDGKTFDGVIGKDLSNPIRDGPSSAPTARWCPHRRRGLPQPRLEVSGSGGCFQQAHEGHLPGRSFSMN